MRAVLMGFAIATVLASTALADDVMATRFGNTTITKDAAGNETHLYYAADGTFSGKQGGQSFKGTWKLDGGNVCLTAETPIPNTPNPVCAPISAHQVGDTWTAGPYTVSLVAGIQ
jgi:hypothetical protein